MEDKGHLIFTDGELITIKDMITGISGTGRSYSEAMLVLVDATLRSNAEECSLLTRAFYGTTRV